MHSIYTQKYPGPPGWRKTVLQSTPASLWSAPMSLYIVWGVSVIFDGAGDVDYICNWLGNKHWTTAMKWPHQSEYAAAPGHPLALALY
jgi:hypothetical protein